MFLVSLTVDSLVPFLKVEVVAAGGDIVDCVLLLFFRVATDETGRIIALAEVKRCR
jgi:hypothetical protein